MPPTQIRCEDPRSTQTIGTFRVARAELAVPLNTLEISVAEPRFSQLVMQVFEKVCTREDTDKIAPDREYAVDGGLIKLGRYQPFSLEEELGQKSLTDSDYTKTLRISKPSLLNTLSWVNEALSPSLGDHQVEIQTRAVGLNFRVSMVAAP